VYGCRLNPVGVRRVDNTIESSWDFVGVGVEEDGFLKFTVDRRLLQSLPKFIEVERRRNGAEGEGVGEAKEHAERSRIARI